MKILVVCSSNICRSPYAEFWIRKLVSESPILKDKGIEVSSSAVFNRSFKIHPKAAKCLIDEGFDPEYIYSHKPSFKFGARQKFNDADVIIGMSKMHRAMTPRKYRDKFITMSEAATGRYENIPDPFLAKSQEEYNKVMKVLRDYIVLYVKGLENTYR